MQIIAEVKTKSPYGFQSKYSWEELFAVASQVGDVISIHTDPRWNGSIEDVRKARSLTKKPILAKGIHTHDEDIKNALAAGADYVLVVGRIPSRYLENCWLEPNNLSGLKSYPAGSKVVWNARDLSTGKSKKETFSQARSQWPGWLCQASLIRTTADIEPSADAILVGTNLIEFADSL